jgi:hypothetical protein
MSEHTLNGIVEMTADAYHLSDGVSKSMLDQLAHPKTPAHLRAYLDEPRPEPTDAMQFGTVLHAALLQPETMSNIAVRPEGLDLRTKTGKEWAEANNDRTIISCDRMKAIKRMVDNVWTHPIAKRLLTGSDFERSLFATDQNGTLRKGRLDVLTKAGNILPDVKTCESAAPDDFEKQIFNYRYFVQAPYYLDLCEMIGIEKEHFVFIAVEKSPPYCVAVHELDPLIVEAGRKTYQRDLALYRECMESGYWPGYPTAVGLVSVPPWARKALEEMGA